jgi:hypothetical protein
MPQQVLTIPLDEKIVKYANSLGGTKITNCFSHCIKDFESTTDTSGIILLEFNSKLVSRRTFSTSMDIIGMTAIKGLMDLRHYMMTGETSEAFSSIEFDKVKRNEYVKRESKS